MPDPTREQLAELLQVTYVNYPPDRFGVFVAMADAVTALLSEQLPPVPGRFRVGNSLGITVYKGPASEDVMGTMQSPEYAALVVDALNRAESSGRELVSVGRASTPGPTLYCPACRINRHWDEEDAHGEGTEHWPGTGMALPCPRCGVAAAPATAEAVVEQLRRQAPQPKVLLRGTLKRIAFADVPLDQPIAVIEDTEAQL